MLLFLVIVIVMVVAIVVAVAVVVAMPKPVEFVVVRSSTPTTNAVYLMILPSLKFLFHVGP